MSSKLMKLFRTFPKDIFRVNNGPHVQLREYVEGLRVYDIHVTHGMVKPLAPHAQVFEAPNGASMRPNSTNQQRLVGSSFKGPNVIVYAVAAGTPLPEDLVLVHERSDHYSLQPSKVMTLQGLDSAITNFLWHKATMYTREQWIDKYPAPTDFHGRI
ncbi:hypothetical protein G6O67_002995 [Ophiocordyceps sinensis]|uniref:Tse2 ADP-ribosyltransferase toxin domain-containing protein n=1 Tax=Ophiocordyceps sinensis TaxID=72228 RepID=A0A8H4V854_9HYPO|nr:hypothetical protein G6O67_002995 [Ophiocordyceps sinensis]